MEQSLIIRREGRIARIRLNRPAALNALDLTMLQAIDAALASFGDDPLIHAVVLDSAHDRAFCSGGDVRTIRELALAADDGAIRTFFAAEYGLNHRIAEFPKPYIALVDGICMGGGIGVSVHGAARVATEYAAFAMPETAIGLFPDIGASFFFPRLPGALGIWLGLTGTRLKGADAAHAGLATHFVPRARLPALARALASDGPGVLAAFAAPLPPFSFAPLRAAIDRCFSAPTLPELLARLASEGSFGADTLAGLRARSPSSLFWTFEILSRGARRNLAQALAAELRLVLEVVRYPDFAEGVRAMVIAKDHRPAWTPPRLEEVDPAAIAAMFADDPLP